MSTPARRNTEGYKMLMQPRLLPRLRWLAVPLFFSPMLLWAQTPAGSISGTVYDSTGAVVPNAAMTMTNKDTGLLRNLLSSADGSYTVAALPPGTYQVKTAMPG